MRAFKIGLLSSLFLTTLSFILIIGCEKTKDLEQASEAVVADTPDTTQAQQKVPSIEGLEKRTVEVETRLETLLSLIEEKENALLKREGNLEARAAELDKAEQRLKTHQTVSWVVLGLGVAAIFLGFVIGKRRRKKTEVETKTAVKKDEPEVKAEAKAEEKKEKAEEAKAESQVEEKLADEKAVGKEATKEKLQPKKESKSK